MSKLERKPRVGEFVLFNPETPDGESRRLLAALVTGTFPTVSLAVFWPGASVYDAKVAVKQGDGQNEWNFPAE